MSIQDSSVLDVTHAAMHSATAANPVNADGSACLTAELGKLPAALLCPGRVGLLWPQQVQQARQLHVPVAGGHNISMESADSAHADLRLAGKTDLVLASACDSQGPLAAGSRAMQQQ